MPQPKDVCIDRHDPWTYRLVEDANAVVAIGAGEGTHRSGAVHRFAFCDVFTFEGDLVARVESYLVPLGDPAAPGADGRPGE